MFSEIFFQDKIFFLLFLIIPVILFLYFKKNKNFEINEWIWIKISFFNSAKKFFWPKKNNSKIKNFLENFFYNFKKFYSIILKILVLILLIFVIAKPQLQNISVERKYSWIDVVLAVDVSLSMLAEDMKPNRITVAKNTILDFIDWLRLWDRMSLVIFSWRPFTNIPLTWDLNILSDFTEFLSTDLINQNVIWLNWTWIWDALLYSIDKFWKNNDREKIIILMTDWESNRWMSPSEPTKLAIDEKIKVYTIWIWKREWAEIPLVLQNWEKWFIKNLDWSKFLTSLDERTMIQIAQNTWWKYFYSDKKDTLEEIFKEIYSLEKKDVIFENKKTFKDCFYYFAFFAFFLFCLESVLSLTFFRKKY